jgi:hypothetical protein
MALVHRATLTPGKQELVAAWLPGRPWAAGIEVADKVAEYRFDDPAGEVGIETILFETVDGSWIQVPLSYRAAPLPGAEDFLIGTTDHSVLGTRWVYDATIDPVWATTLTASILTGGAQAQMYLIGDDGERIDIPARMTVRGSGEPGTASPVFASVDSAIDQGAGAQTVALSRVGDVELVVARVVGAAIDTDETLRGRVGERDVVLAGLRRR